MKKGTGMTVLIVIAVVVALVIVRFVLPAGTPRIHRSGSADRTKSVAVLEKVRIGGIDQWVMERTEEVANPILPVPL
jgi:hypothetical protein